MGRMKWTLAFIPQALTLVALGAIAGQASVFITQQLAGNRMDSMGAIVLFDELRYEDENTRCNYIPGLLYFWNTDSEPITGLEF